MILNKHISLSPTVNNISTVVTITSDKNAQNRKLIPSPFSSFIRLTLPNVSIGGNFSSESFLNIKIRLIHFGTSTTKEQIYDGLIVYKRHMFA